MPLVKLNKATINTDHLIAIKPAKQDLYPGATELFFVGGYRILVTETEAAYIERLLDSDEGYSEAATTQPLALSAQQITDKVAQLLRDYYPSGISLDGLEDYFANNAMFEPFVNTVPLAVERLKHERVAVERLGLIYHASHDPQRNQLDLSDFTEVEAGGLADKIIAEDSELNQALRDIEPNW